MQYLRRNTAVKILIGPFVSWADGKTLESSIAEADWEQANTKIHITPNVGGSARLTAFGSADANYIQSVISTAIPGYYNMDLTAANVNLTHGGLTIAFADEDASPIFQPLRMDFEVIEQVNYDAFIRNLKEWPISTTDMNTIVDKVWDEPGADHVAANSMGAQLETLLDTIASNITDIMGTGFATATHSLKVLRDYLDASIVPLLTTSTATSGSGFLSDCVSWIRKKIDEPATNAKYTNADIVNAIQRALYTVLMDLQFNLDHPILVRYELTMVSGQQTYTLPTSVGQIMRVAKINSINQIPEWEIWPGTEISGSGIGMQVEGNTLRLLSDWKATHTIQILYTPTPETLLHTGTSQGDTVVDLTTHQWTDSPAKAGEFYVDLTGGSDPTFVQPTVVYVNGTLYTEGTVGSLAANEFDYADNDTLGYSTVYIKGDPTTTQVSFDANNSDNDTLVLDDTPADGTLDTRLGCYQGYMCRLLADGNGYAQERIVNNYDRTKRLVTLSEGFSPAPTGTVTYEVIPSYSKILEDVVCLETAHDILAGEGNMKRMQTLERELAKKKVALRRSVYKRLARFPTSLNSDTMDNVSRGAFNAFGWN